MEKTEIVIKDIVGSANWIQVADGAKVYDKILLALKAGSEVVLSFAGRTFVITAFLNAAIGKLYNGQFTDADLAHLSYANTEVSDDEKIQRVVANAKVYYKNNPQFRDKLFKREVEA
ncbi:MAG: STAS-like domain-containing protein [bacterium]|nr:STAS-like domain-containing protein [bacterium]